MTPGLKNICIYGAGALGGTLAARLAEGLGEQVCVSVIARGAHLEKIRENGLQLHVAGEDKPSVVAVTATDNPADLPKQDLIITGMKGHQLPAAAEGIATLLSTHSRVVMVLNGIPWWYFHGDEKSERADHRLPELDPGNRLWDAVGPERVIGCVAYQGAEVVEPSVIRLPVRGRFILGEPSGDISADLTAISDLLTRAGVNIIQTADIRGEIWSKLMGNASFNPISALTRALSDRIVAEPALLGLMSRVMTEVHGIATALGHPPAQTVAERLKEAMTIGPHPTSMLQDLLARKPLEYVPLVDTVVRLAHMTGTPVPALETILALIGELDRQNRADAG
ncbi:ketopantoate reductase family protein [Neorhizobium sp. NPDC001467]|uniref:ketopantoate reductase family protein n=1 Tax=Neorhizobium sp. NPDC001467 TaxID=3390595 RepID=UPI003D01B490